MSQHHSEFPNYQSGLNYALSDEPILLNGMKVIFDQSASVYPVSLQPRFSEFGNQYSQAKTNSIKQDLWKYNKLLKNTVEELEQHLTNDIISLLNAIAEFMQKAKDHSNKNEVLNSLREIIGILENENIFLQLQEPGFFNTELKSIYESGNINNKTIQNIIKNLLDAVRKLLIKRDKMLFESKNKSGEKQQVNSTVARKRNRTNAIIKRGKNEYSETIVELPPETKKEQKTESLTKSIVIKKKNKSGAGIHGFNKSNGKISPGVETHVQVGKTIFVDFSDIQIRNKEKYVFCRYFNKENGNKYEGYIKLAYVMTPKQTYLDTMLDQIEYPDLYQLLREASIKEYSTENLHFITDIEKLINKIKEIDTNIDKFRDYVEQYKNKCQTFKNLITVDLNIIERNYMLEDAPQIVNLAGADIREAKEKINDLFLNIRTQQIELSDIKSKLLKILNNLLISVKNNVADTVSRLKK